MRAGIAALPDGTYRFADTYDNPELGRALPVSVEITIDGSEMRLHFDSPPQVRAGINMIYTALLSSVHYAVKAVVDPTILPNSGLARPITVTAPLGTVMNATHPAAVNGRTSTCQRAADLVIGALAQAAPERCIAAGNGPCTTASFAGRFRGGMGLRRVYRAEECQLRLDGSRLLTPPWALEGGHPGGCGAFRLATASSRSSTEVVCCVPGEQ